MAGGDFVLSITGNITGFDTGPVDDFVSSVTKIPSAASSASSSTLALGNSLNTVSSSANSTAGPMGALSRSTQTTGQQFQATGALANAFGNEMNVAKASTQQLVGANGALGTSFAPLEGGLTKSNELTTNLATTQERTRTSTENFRLGLTTLVGGFTTLVGSGIQLFGMYHELESAVVKADAAHLKYEKALLTASKAHERVNKLVAEGKTGTLDYTQAVDGARNADEQVAITADKWKLAQDSLNIAQANFASEILPAVISAVGGVITSFSGIKSTLPGLISGFASFGGNVKNLGSMFASGIGAVKDFVTGLTGLSVAEDVASGSAAAGAPKFLSDAAAKGVATGATATLTTALRGLAGAMAAVAIPLAAGAAAVAGFLAVMKALSDNLGGSRTAFEGFGVAVGNTIPQLKDFVTKLGDAGRSTVDFFSRYSEAVTNFLHITDTHIDFSKRKLSELITEWKKQGTTHSAVVDHAIEEVINWGKTHNLTIDQIIAIEKKQEAAVKSMGNANTTAIEPTIPIMHSLGISFSTMATAAEASIGTMEGVVGVIARSGDAALTLTGKYVILGQGTKSTSEIMAAAFDAIDKAVDSDKTKIAEWAIAHGQAVSVAGQSSSQLKLMAQFFGQVTTAEEDNQQKAVAWLVAHKQINLVINQGISAAIKYALAHGALTENIKKGGEAQKTYAQTLAESIAKTNEEAQALQASVTSGQNAQKTIADLNKAYADSVAKLDTLNTKLTDGRAQQLQYATSVNEGIAAFDQWILKTKDAAIQAQIFDDGLKQMTDGFFQANPLIKQTAENMKTVGEAMLGSAEAAKKTHDLIVKAFEPLGNDMAKVVDDIAGKFEDLNKKVKKPFKDLPDYIRKSLTPEMKDFEVAQARFKVLGEQMSGHFGIALAQGGAAGALDFVQRVQNNLKNLGDKAALQPIIDDLQGAVANAGTPAGNAFVQKAIAELQKMGPDGQQMAEQLANKFGVGLDTGLAPVPGIVQKNVVDPFTGLPSTAQAVAAKIATAFTDLGTAFEEIPAFIANTFGAGFNGAMVQAANQLGQLPALVSGVVAQTNPAWATMQAVAGAAFNQVLVVASTQLGALPALIAGVVTQTSASWATMQSTAGAAFNAVLVEANTQLGALPALITGVVAQTNASWLGMVPVASGAFNQIMASASTQFGLLSPMIAGIITDIGGQLQGLVIAFTAAFNKATQNAAGTMNNLAKNVQQNIANMISAVNAIPIAFTSAFNTATQNAAGTMNNLARNVQTNIQNMISATNAFAIAITSNFNKGAQNAAGSMNSLANNVNSNANNMISKINAVANAMSQIGKNADTARGKVDALKNAINALPASKTVNINIIEHRTVVQRTVPAPIGTAALGGGAAGTATVLPAARLGARRTVSVEVKEPTIIKINERELVRLINKKIIELDIGAIA